MKKNIIYIAGSLLALFLIIFGIVTVLHLEKKIDNLEYQNRVLETTNSRLETTNNRLTDDVEYYTDMLDSNQEECEAYFEDDSEEITIRTPGHMYSIWTYNKELPNK